MKREWTVEHHLPGQRYGAITIHDADDTPRLKMWVDDGAHLRLAEQIVKLLNRVSGCLCTEPTIKIQAGVGAYCTTCKRYRKN